MKESKNKINALRSNCPINYTLEIVGDKWSLLIIRDIVFAGKQTFGEFLESDEKIARNILSARLKMLEEQVILQRKKHPTDGRKDIFTLTNKGMSLVPLLLQAADWAIKNKPGVDQFQKILGMPPYTNNRNIKMLQRLINENE